LFRELRRSTFIGARNFFRDSVPVLGCWTHDGFDEAVGEMKKQISSSRTHAERISWMSRTSDVVGSFHNVTPEACTTLIRRKIQERCNTTQDLMSAIRRLKTGSTGHVTPNEFKLTLLKFGIMIPPHQLEQIFNLFDSDRSGTIDFDEFAMWIMNSEFHPVPKMSKKQIEKSPKEVLRQKLRNYVTEFATLLLVPTKKDLDFLELLTFCHQKELTSLSDNEIRALFHLLDPKNTGLISTAKLSAFIMEDTSSSSSFSQHPPPSRHGPSSAHKPNLQQAILKVCHGSSPQELLHCFDHLRGGGGGGVMEAPRFINFSEFSRCLQSKSLGFVRESVSDLFLALNGSDTRGCDLRLLFDAIPPMKARASSAVTRSLPNQITPSKVHLPDLSH
jgi:Ca2+-binding EF-hand superfamily protein